MRKLALIAALCWAAPAMADKAQATQLLVNNLVSMGGDTAQATTIARCFVDRMTDAQAAAFVAARTSAEREVVVLLPMRRIDAQPQQKVRKRIDTDVAQAAHSCDVARCCKRILRSRATRKASIEVGRPPVGIGDRRVVEQRIGSQRTLLVRQCIQKRLERAAGTATAG